MRKQPFYLILALISLILLSLACNLPNMGPSGVDEVSAVYTMAAQTVQAQLTQAATQGAALEPSPTPTLYPTSTLALTSTPFPTNTPWPTATPLPDVPQPTATRTSSNNNSGGPVNSTPCYRAEFVKDVTVKDGTVFAPGEAFTKTWRIRNDGDCTWQRDFELIFVKGDDMNGDDVQIGERVEPGETIDISIDLVAPSERGDYKGFWMFSGDEGRFGAGDNADKAFWVDIEVDKAREGEVLNFVNSYCSARWVSSDGRLDCPGDEGDEQGYVIRLENPDQENRTENEPALLTYPEMVDDGWIQGTYPEFKVKAGDRFISDVGCLNDNRRCDVIFSVSYQVGNGDVKKLGEWREVYDEFITRIDLDLSSLADQSIKIILSVHTNGSPRNDAAFWLMPHIQRP